MVIVSVREKNLIMPVEGLQRTDSILFVGIFVCIETIIDCGQNFVCWCLHVFEAKKW